MARSALAQAIDLIKELNVEELEQLQEVIQGRLAPNGESTAIERFQKALLASGLVKEIKRPSREPGDRPPPVPFKGKPISETIIEERR